MKTHLPIGLFDRVTAAPAVHARQFDDEVILLDLASGQYFSLNAIASRMWNGFLAGRSPHEVACDLAPDYDVEEDILARDCVSLANELVERGMLAVEGR